MSKKYCLRIKTFDERSIYTSFNNYSKIAKYKKILIKEISKVLFKEQKILSLKNLSSAVADHTFNDNKISKKNDNLSDDIKTYIMKSFETNRFLNFNNLKDKFKDYDVTTANLYNYLNNIKKLYKKDGKEIKRIRSGIFKIQED